MPTIVFVVALDRVIAKRGLSQSPERPAEGRPVLEHRGQVLDPTAGIGIPVRSDSGDTAQWQVCPAPRLPHAVNSHTASVTCAAGALGYYSQETFFPRS